tara:strand:- start:529 stop:1218 length:690 start_codon:yes stop_codon:yes gene_type:complete
MKLAALFSGGKDSLYAIFLAKNFGNSIDVLLTLHPFSDDSHLLHHPNIKFTKLQSESMEIPQLVEKVDSINTSIEIEKLENLIIEAKKQYNIQGIVHGGILSQFQKDNFLSISQKHQLDVISPLWKKEPISYMNEVIENNFEFIISAVGSAGLDDSWLGKKIDQNSLNDLKSLQEKFGFNLSFEGGEAETFVTDCPLFKKSLKIVNSSTKWDGYRGRFEILEAELEDNA